ncbi:phage tail protein [Nocardia sp. NPDC060249]|uniref:Gp37-like protein n=1 Tax=Nocardia sp. NPDC060249 TaxID=3347082 RepID=UPI003647844E
MTDITTLTLEQQCEAIWDATKAREKADEQSRREPPLVRIWNGDWDLQGILATEYSAEFTWIDNDAGTGMTEIPLSDPIARWIWGVKDRIENGEKRNVHITVDKDGARWSGRLHDHTVEKREDGTRVLVVRWMHDMENLKYYQIWSNPFLPAAVQFPRTFLLAGPSIWCLKTALFLNVMREQESVWHLPDDPMSQTSSGPGMSNWSVVVKPTTFLDDMNAGTLWSVPSSRWKYFHDMADSILEDSQLSIVCRRFIATDDEQPIAGETLRNGCLVIDIVDQSGYYSDTSNGGDPFLGLKRTFAQFAEDFIDSVLEPVADPVVPDSYKIPGQKLTDKTCPYVVYFEGEETGVESSKFIYTPATAMQINCGGKSMPGVNELISASIQMAGDLVAMMVGVPPVGGAIDALLAPLYTDTLLAWVSLPSNARVANSGWSRYWEYFQTGADRGYTLESLAALRTGFHETRSWFSHEILIRDAAPWYIGENGKGHFFIGDRIGAQVVGDFTKQIYIDRVRELTLAWDRDSFAEWRPVIGEKEKNKDRGLRALGFISDIFAAVKDLGVTS